MRNTMKLKLTYDEIRVLIFALNELRNNLIAENRYTDAACECHWQGILEQLSEVSMDIS